MNGMWPTAPVVAEDLLSHVLPHKIAGLNVGGLAITNQMLMSFLAAILVVGVFGYVATRVRTHGSGVDAYVTRGRFAQLFEVIAIYLRQNVAQPSLQHLTDKYIYYVWSVFFFILFINLLGILPIGPLLVWITGNEHLAHMGGNANTNLSMTAAMATLSFLMIVGVGIKEQGMKSFAHFAPIPIWPIMNGASIAMLPLALFLVVLEAAGLIIKCVVLAMRLFGTMLAGHLVIAALIGMILASGSWLVGGAVMVGGLLISLLELFIIFLQAFIFTFLTVLFISAGAVHEHEDHEKDHASVPDGLVPEG